MSTTSNMIFAFSSIGIMAKCDCSLSSMALEKMPLTVDQTPTPLQHNIVAGDPAVKVNVPLQYDTISWNCGNADGTSFCGSTGSSGVDVTF